MRSKGVWHFGFGVFFLILIVLYVALYFIAPTIAEGIKTALSQLFGAVMV